MMNVHCFAILSNDGLIRKTERFSEIKKFFNMLDKYHYQESV